QHRHAPATPSRQGQGSALKPARGLCPLDPHQRRSLWDPSILFGAREGGPWPASAAAIAPATAGREAGPGPPSRAPNTTEGFQGPLPLAGVQRAAPSGGVRGKAPAFLWFTRLPRGPGARDVAGSSSAGAPRGWAARARTASAAAVPPPAPRFMG